MALGIPLPNPNAGPEALQRGVESGTNLFAQLMGQGIQRKQLGQQWQQHLQNAEMRKIQQLIQQQQQDRLSEQFEMEKQLHPYAIQAAEQKQQLGPAQYGLLMAKIEAEKARAEKSRREPSANYKPSELERIAEMLSQGNQDKRNELLAEGAATKYGLTLPGAENLPVGSQPFKSLPKNLQAQENADQIKMQFKVNDAKKANHDLDAMEDIINSNPDMARDFAYILGNPEDKSFISNLSRRYIDKKKLAAVEKFTKLSNDFVLAAGGGLGNNFTDAKLKALQLSKMHAGNTDEANRAIINNYRQKLRPLINYGSELKKARGKYTLPYFEESYSDEALGRGKPPIENLSDEELESLLGGS